MLPPAHLDVHVLVVVLVQGRDGARVADPEVDGVGLLLQRDAGEGDVARDVVEEAAVFGAEVVVLWSPFSRVGLGWGER